MGWYYFRLISGSAEFTRTTENSAKLRLKNTESIKCQQLMSATSLVNSQVRSVLQFERQNIISVTQMIICNGHQRVPADFFFRLIFGWTHSAYISASRIFFGGFSADRNAAANPDIRIRLGALCFKPRLEHDLGRCRPRCNHKVTRYLFWTFDVTILTVIERINSERTTFYWQVLTTTTTHWIICSASIQVFGGKSAGLSRRLWRVWYVAVLFVLNMWAK